jgi:hypothetical protein
MNQRRPAGFILAEVLLQKREPLAGELDVQLEPGVRLLDLANLVDLVGRKKIAILRPATGSEYDNDC